MSKLIKIDIKYIFRLIDEWKQVKTHFLRPKIKFSKYVDEYGKNILTIYAQPLMWKPKYDYFSVEREPSIIIKLFKTIYRFNFGAPNELYWEDDILYWEAMLDFHNSKDIKSTYNNNIWTHYIDENKTIKVNIERFLTKHGKSELNK